MNQSSVASSNIDSGLLHPYVIANGLQSISNLNSASTASSMDLFCFRNLMVGQPQSIISGSTVFSSIKESKQYRDKVLVSHQSRKFSYHKLQSLHSMLDSTVIASSPTISTSHTLQRCKNVGAFAHFS